MSVLEGVNTFTGALTATASFPLGGAAPPFAPAYPNVARFDTCLVTRALIESKVFLK